MKYIEINFQTRVFLPVRVKPFLPVWTIYIKTSVQFESYHNHELNGIFLIQQDKSDVHLTT